MKIIPILLTSIIIRILIAIILIFLTIKTGDQFKITIIKIGYIIVIIIIIIVIIIIKTGDLPNTLFCTCRSHLRGLQ